MPLRMNRASNAQPQNFRSVPHSYWGGSEKTMYDEDLFENHEHDTATHEAGHVVMRRIVGRCATAVHVYKTPRPDPDLGEECLGYCEGDGLEIDSLSSALIALGGPAAEVGMMPTFLNKAALKGGV